MFSQAKNVQGTEAQPRFWRFGQSPDRRAGVAGRLGKVVK
jgi:hypothetical protein